MNINWRSVAMTVIKVMPAKVRPEIFSCRVKCVIFSYMTPIVAMSSWNQWIHTLEGIFTLLVKEIVKYLR